MWWPPPHVFLLLLLLPLPPLNSPFAAAQQPPGSFYGGSVEWALLPDADASESGQRTVEFFIRTHWQRSFSAYKGSSGDGSAAVGDQLPLQGQSSVLFDFGDGSAVTELTGTVASIDVSLDIVSFISVLRHSYPAPCRNVSYTPAFFSRPQGGGSSNSPPPLTTQEMRVHRTPWSAQLSACCSAPSLHFASSAPAAGTVVIAAAVDFTFTSSSPKLSFPSVLLAARTNTTLPLHAAAYTGTWPCTSASSEQSSACQWQPELVSASVAWALPFLSPLSSASSHFVLNGSSVTILGCEGACGALLLMLQVWVCNVTCEV
jgi:hypothetical protein